MQVSDFIGTIKKGKIRMTIFKQPKDGEGIRNENIVIGYFEDRIIVVKNEWGELLFLYGKPEYAELGTIIENEALAPIKNLTPLEQQGITNLFSKKK